MFGDLSVTAGVRVKRIQRDTHTLVTVDLNGTNENSLIINFKLYATVLKTTGSVSSSLLARSA